MKTDITRRAALAGSTAAILAAGMNTAAAAPIDPHIAWLAEMDQIEATLIAMGSEEDALNGALIRDLGRVQPAVTVNAGSRTYVTDRQAIIDILDGLPTLDDLKDRDALNQVSFRRLRQTWEKALEEFDAKTARFEAHPAYQRMKEWERRTNELIDQDDKISRLMVDTPAKTLAGVHAQAVLLERWTRDGLEYLDERESEIAARIREALAKIIGQQEPAQHSRPA
ncbi:hypothetical protein HH303_18890 [Rhodospirillaceae bacterium KN72]|uniref:Uncharacterized protein n=1 Tax=Pacificispira spongiicola TaxID=2729598 RepID=A0A7Y0HG54_9PROT|nr:hypothetical protein [Pacificispira spongiicola]NMM46565.1 hypothetical protein [Pacificispira spongiicola]